MAITPTYSIGFSVAQGSRSGSISVTLTTDLVGLGIDPSDVEVAYGVSGPSGLLRQGGVFGVGGNIHPDVSYTGTIPLPLDITGTQVLEGIYTVDIVMRVVGAVEPGDWRAGPTQSELCTSCIPELCLDVQVDCLRAQVTATDTTAWTQSGWTVSRLLTLKYPGGFSHADITSTSSIVGTGSEPIPSRGTWTAIAEVTATKGALTVTITNTRAPPEDGSASFSDTRGRRNRSVESGRIREDPRESPGCSTGVEDGRDSRGGTRSSDG